MGWGQAERCSGATHALRACPPRSLPRTARRPHAPRPLRRPAPPRAAAQLAYILARHGLSLDLEEGPAAVEDEELREQLQQIIRCAGWEAAPRLPLARCLHAAAAACTTQPPSPFWPPALPTAAAARPRSNTKLSERYLALARDLDVMEAKTPEDVYKMHLVEGRAPSGGWCRPTWEACCVFVHI